LKQLKKTALNLAVVVVLATTGSSILFAGANVQAAELSGEPQVRAFIDDMTRRHGFVEAELEALVNEAKILDSILKAISRPAEGKPWYAYREIFLKPNRIDGGAAFWDQHVQTLERAEEQFGVPAAVIVAIIGVETLYGEYRGKLRVLDALATLGFRYPKRSKFFTRELEHFLLLTREEGLDARSLTGSYAGAMGIPQFIPSSYRAYAVDFDGDNVRDLLGSTEDAIGSVASYLAEHGWRRGQPITVPAKVSGTAYKAFVEAGIKPEISVARMQSNHVEVFEPLHADAKAALLEFELRDGVEHWLGLKNFYVITRYNHSQLYAMAVFQLAEAIQALRDGAN